MQIHEITQAQTRQLDEGLASAAGAGVGRAVSGVKNVASFVTNPFKDIGQGYKTARMDQKTSALADKMYRAWQQYSVQWAKSQGGSYTQPGQAAPAAKSAGTPAPATPAAPAAGVVPSTKSKAQDLFGAVQSLDNRALNSIAKILSQRVGPAATMAALKKPESPAATGQVEEAVNWAGMGAKVAQGAKNVAGAVGQMAKQGIQQAPALARQVGQQYNKAAKAGMQAVKAAPGAVATAAGATAGAVAGMPAKAKTAYRASKQQVSGPQMTPTELQNAIYKLTPAEAKKLLNYIQQIQQMRKAGIREGVTPATLVPDWEQALKSFVQQNLLAGMQYSRLQNAQQIDDLIKQIVDPANDTASAQKDLWNKLTRAAAVAQYQPAQAGGTKPAASAPAGAKPTAQAGGEDAESLVPTVKQVLDQAGAKDGTLRAIGQAVTRGFTQNSTAIQSTGVPAVDAMLMTMGFRPA